MTGTLELPALDETGKDTDNEYLSGPIFQLLGELEESRARISASSTRPEFSARQASSASIPLSHHGTPASRASAAALGDQLERVRVVAWPPSDVRLLQVVGGLPWSAGWATLRTEDE
jgi:hypothetical protein